MNLTSEAIIRLLSYSATDYAVSSSEESKIIELIRADANFGDTLYDLHKKGFVPKLFARIDSGNNNQILVQTIAGKLASSGYPLAIESVKKHTTLKQEFDNSYHLQQFMKMQGLSSRSTVLANTAIQKLLSSLPKKTAASPFSGSGASGQNIKSQNISAIDKIQIARKDATTVAKYSNPIPGSLGGYLQGLTKDQRKAQATVLLKRPIFSLYPYSYQGELPSRADILKISGKKFQLEPALVAAFVLAEQRDQSRNEDAKDYIAATSLFQANTSIGLGQVVISTVRRNDLFSDLLPSGATKSLSHNELAALLISDEFNIIAVAKYIRLVANEGNKKDIKSLPETKKEFPSIDLKKYGLHSSQWPEDNIRALSSEYTSRAWDDRLSPGWAYFVYEAYQDIKASGVL